MKKLAFLLIFLMCLLATVMARFYTIQIEEHEQWLKKAERQHFFTIREPAPRGTFFANTDLKPGHPSFPQKLVFDIEKFHLHADPASIPDNLKETVYKHLSQLLEASPEEKDSFKEQLSRKSRNRKLVMWLTKEQREDILEWWLPFAREHRIPKNALFFVTDYERSYPFGHLLGQLLHTTRSQKNEAHGFAIPTGGLELYFDQLLRGIPGKRRLMRSPRNAFEVGDIIEKPVKGADIYLTVNHHLQMIVEEELAKGVKKCQAKSGRAIIMEPETGEILAIAQYPFFSPAYYKNYFNDPLLLQHTQLGSAIEAIEPGSVMKAFTTCAVFLANAELQNRGEELLFDPEEIIPTSNGYFPGRSKPISDTRLHYFLNLPMAIQKSSNIYLGRQMEKIITRLGSAWYRRFLYETLGFGKKTGIEFPVETAGVVPTIGKLHPNGTPQWAKCTPYSLSMGYNLLVNEFQLVRAYGVLANGGYQVQPTFVRKVISYESGQPEVIIDNTKPERKSQFPLILPPKVVEAVVKTMKYTTKPGGTCVKADIYGYSEAGKTGTARKIVNGIYQKIHRSSFIGFAPLKKPAFVLYVMMDEPKNGAAGPLFSKIGKRVLTYLGVAPDDPYGYPNGDPRADPAKADWVLESQKLEQTYYLWNSKKS